MAGPGKPGGSRKGRPNKIGYHVKQNVIDVFDLIGGIEGMVKWAKRNRTEFYRLYARLIPTEVTAHINIRDASELSDDELVAIITEGSGSGATGTSAGEEKLTQIH